MDKRKYWFTRIFYLLFTLSVSVTVLPCGIINTYGLFGEITSSTVTEDKEQEIFEKQSQIHEVGSKIKGLNVFNVWFYLLIVVICIIFIEYRVKLPRGDTIITLKVRMDN